LIVVETDAGEDWDSRTGWAALARDAILSAVRCSAHSGLIESELGVEVSVKFTDDAEVRALNANWRGKDKATNVLSFPMAEPNQLDAAGGEILLGDIVLAHGICTAEAADKGVKVESHASHLVVHGALHLLGYDHETGEAEAEAMEQIEREALAALGIADPYTITEVTTH